MFLLFPRFPSLHHHPTSFFSQLMLLTSRSFFFCTLEVVLITDKKPNHYWIVASAIISYSFFLSVQLSCCFFSPSLSFQLKFRLNVAIIWTNVHRDGFLCYKEKQLMKKRKENYIYREIKKKETEQINSKLFKKCILFTAVLSKLLIQCVKV